MSVQGVTAGRCDIMKNLKRKAVIISLFLLSGIFVFTTADVQKEVFSMFIGGVASISLLTIIFFLSGMLQETGIKEKVYPYAVAFSLIVMWIIILTILRIVIKV